MQRRKYLKALGTMGALTTATGVSAAAPKQTVTGLVPKAKVERNENLRAHYEKPFYEITETNTDEFSRGTLKRADNSHTHWIDKTLVTTDNNGRTQFKNGIPVYKVRLNRSQFTREIKRRLRKNHGAVGGKAVTSISEYETRLKEMQAVAANEAEKQIRASLDAREDN